MNFIQLEIVNFYSDFSHGLLQLIECEHYDFLFEVAYLFVICT